VNGSYQLDQPLQARASNGQTPAGNWGAVGSTPLLLLSYTGPMTNDPISLQFRQPIAATQRLRTGSYSKTLTFTLAPVTP
jgi:hypothetical protein